MSSNYNESSIAGTRWRRSFRVQIDNPYGAAPRALFHEEECISLAGGELMRQNVGTLPVAFDQSKEINLINPWTGEPLTNVEGVQQKATHLEIYIILHSLYIQSAIERDQPPPPQQID